MQRLNALLSSLHIDTAQKADAIFEAMGVVEVAMGAPDISRARAEHTLHRLAADILLSKRPRLLH